MSWSKLVLGVGIVWALMPNNAFAKAGEAPAQEVKVPQYAKMAPYRTFITIHNYTMEHNGDAQNPISNVKIEVLFGKNQKMALPEGGQFWPIGNGQKQEINKTYEVPWEAIANDAFAFDIQMVRQGSKMLPCQFNVNQLSQFNRSYFCHTDLRWQSEQKIPDENLDREGIEVRVYTDRNTPAKDLPKDALALR